MNDAERDEVIDRLMLQMDATLLAIEALYLTLADERPQTGQWAVAQLRACAASPGLEQRLSDTLEAMAQYYAKKMRRAAGPESPPGHPAPSRAPRS